MLVRVIPIYRTGISVFGMNPILDDPQDVP